MKTTTEPTLTDIMQAFETVFRDGAHITGVDSGDHFQMKVHFPRPVEDRELRAMLELGTTETLRSGAGVTANIRVFKTQRPESVIKLRFDHDTPNAFASVVTERNRQLSEEGYTVEGDTQENYIGQLLQAGMAYE